MKKTNFARVLAFFLALLMLAGPYSLIGTSAAEAANTGGSSEIKGSGAERKSSLQQMMEILDTISYKEYLEKYKDTPRGTQEITVNSDNFLASQSSTDIKIETDYAETKGKTILTTSEGTAAWEFNVPKTGMYAMKIEYYSVTGKSSSIERMLYIDGYIPFSEARNLVATKVWIDEYENGHGIFDEDINGNNIRPAKLQSPQWCTYVANDSTGFVVNPFQFYLEEGKHVITLESVREAMLIKEIVFYPYEDLLSYAEVQAEYQSKGYKQASDDAYLHIDAEAPHRTSEQTIYPIYDRTSPITEPQSPSLIKYNTIGAEKWKTSGQWIEYDIDVKESGLYKIVLRFKQSELEGMYSSRRIYINGKVPFEEANYLQFNYDANWQVSALSDGTQTNGFDFYLEKGTNTIRFEAVLGHIGEILGRAQEALDMMNTAYTEILKITGATPDQYRDYDFGQLIPDEIGMIGKSAEILRSVSDEMVATTGKRGSHVATLDKIFILLERMYGDEDEIAKNLTNLKTYIGTLGTWLLSSRSMPLEIDYINLQNETTSLPRANANFFQKIWHELRAFIMSFFTDYSSLGAKTEVNENEIVEVWITTGRERTEILRQLIDNEFTPNSNISVNLKLVAGGVLQSTLAGIGPDVAFLGSYDCVNYALRTAVKRLNDFEGFDEVMERFSAGAKETVTLYGDTYGLPNTMSFLMMFYRMDIFANLGLEVPKTWDELHAIIPVLQNNNMAVGFPQKLQGLKMFLYQYEDGNLFADDGKRINLDSNVALTAFEQLCDLFEKYRFPLKYDFANRFRTGEMPIGVVDYISNYNQLTVFAPEIQGLWEFIELPGVMDSSGNISNPAVAEVGAVAMLKGAEGNEANSWEFMKWYTSEVTQSRYSNELVAIVGPSSKYNTANVNALEELPWTSREYRNLMTQFKNTVGIPEYPGCYIIDRYVNFAFLDVYNDGADAVDSLLDIVTDINKEITRKRKEFGFDYIEFDYSTSSQYIESAGD